jgi:predicted permease
VSSDAFLSTATGCRPAVSLFAEILTTVTLPIVVLMALGWVIQHRLQLNVRTLSRLLVNVILPCALFHFLTNAELPLVDVWPTVWFTVLQFAVLSVVGWGIAAVCRVPPMLQPVVGVATAFANTGNFGLPVAQLAFPPDYLLHQTIIVSLHSILIVSFGVLVLAHQRGSLLQSIRALLVSPMILGVAAGILVKGFDVELPYLVTHPIKIISGAYICIALFTLGAQLAETRFSLRLGPVWLTVVLKMALAPALTWAMLRMTDIEAGLADLLVVAAAAPVGLLLAIFCTDYERAPDTAGAMVLITTVLSPVTVTAWIWILRFT